MKASDDAAALFGHAEYLLVPATQNTIEFSSPVIRPHIISGVDTAPSTSPKKSERYDEPMDYLTLDLSATKEILLPDAALQWDNLQSPENIELAELDDMFDAY